MRRWLLLTVAVLFTITGSAAAQVTCPIVQGWETYLIEPGDSLYVIAQQYGTTLDELVSVNCLTDPNLIFAGQPLIVPPLNQPGTVGTIAPEAESQSLIGTYQFTTIGAGGEREIRLALQFDGTVTLATYFVPTSETIIEAGNWLADGSRISVFITGQTVPTSRVYAQSTVLVFEFASGTLNLIEYDPRLYGETGLQLTLGSGDYNPLVEQVQQRLAALPFIALDLGAVQPGLFDDTTRQAVVRFQETQGLVASGVVDAATQAALNNPAAPPPSPPTPAPVTISGVPNLDALPDTTDDGRPILYLTFDDGPSPYTSTVLDVLAANDAQATFFVLGQQVQNFPDLIRAQAATGHYVANHTFDHHTLDGISREQFFDEVRSTEQILLDTAGDLFVQDGRVRFLRPPYGATDVNTRALAAELGYAVVLWTIDPQDWRRPGADAIASHILSHVYPGAILLLHDGGGDRTQTIAALQTVLPQLAGQGYVFRSVFVP